jgi:peptidyl-prolyl cis-trans isomerase D
VAAAARDGATLAEAVEAVGVEAPVIPLDLGTREDLPFEQLAEAGFALEARGAVSEPVETPFGWHVMKLTGLEEAGIAPFEAVRDEIEQELQLDRALDAVFEMANQLEDELAGGATLEQAADTLGLPVIDVPPVAADGSLRGDAALPDLPAEEQVLETAFQTPAGEAAPMQETREGDFFIVRVDGVIPPELRPLDQVREEVRTAWQAAERREIAAARAAQAAERLALGGAPQEVADALGGTAGTTPPVTRDGAGAGDLAPGLPAALFELAPGAADVVAADDRRIAVRLEQVREAEPSAAGDAMVELRGRVARGMAQDLVDQYAAALRAREGVTVDQPALDRYLRQVEG